MCQRTEKLPSGTQKANNKSKGRKWPLNESMKQSPQVQVSHCLSQTGGKRKESSAKEIKAFEAGVI